jgi:hypothetical protein
VLEACGHQLVKEFLLFVEPEGSLPCPQETTTGPNFEPHAFCPYYGIFIQGKNSGAGETAIAMQLLRENQVHFKATAW